VKDSHISWTHHTFNPWVGCDKIAPECSHCYIDREIRKQVDWQNPTRIGGKSLTRKPWGEVYLTKTWQDPHKWQSELQKMMQSRAFADPHGDKLIYSRVFTCSLSDFFHAKVDDRTIVWKHSSVRRGLSIHTNVADRAKSDKWRDCAWQIIRDTPNLVYLILTKRPELIEARLPKDWGQGYKNVWLGTSVGSKLTLSKMDSLRKIPVHPEAVRFVSCEPLLEDISADINLDGFGWVIAGGESGTNPEYLWPIAGVDWRKEFDMSGRRTMKVEWAYNLMLSAKRNLLPYWFKQMTASRAGQGEDALGFRMQEVPLPPKDGTWIPEHADAVSEEAIEPSAKKSDGTSATSSIASTSNYKEEGEKT
jgi:protein gp37